MVINPIVGVYIPIRSLPIKRWEVSHPQYKELIDLGSCKDAQKKKKKNDAGKNKALIKTDGVDSVSTLGLTWYLFETTKLQARSYWNVPILD